MERDIKIRNTKDRQQHTIEVRERIVSAVEKLIYEYGYLRVTIRDIAKTVGTSSSNIYRYFDSKDAVMKSLVQHIAQQIEESCLQAFESKGNASQRLTRVIVEYHRICTERYYSAPGARELFRAATLENPNLTTMHSEHLGKMFWDLILEGVHNKEFKVNDLDAATRMVCHAITDFVDPMQITKDSNRDTDFKETKEMCQFVLGSLKSGSL